MTPSEFYSVASPVLTPACIIAVSYLALSPAVAAPGDYNVGSSTRNTPTVLYLPTSVEHSVSTSDRQPYAVVVDGPAFAYAQIQEKVAGFGRLPTGWNSYSAEAPGKQAIDLALRFTNLVAKHGFRIDWVAPSVDDSVMLTISARSGKQEWEFFGDGGTAVMYRNAHGEKDFVDLEESDFEGFLTR